MRESLLQWLCCPGCRGSLALKPSVGKKDEVVEGQLACGSCGALYPIVRSIPRFVPTDLYVGNFSFQWNRFSRAMFDEGGRNHSATTFSEKTGFRLEELDRKLVLDVGVGNGRYADLVERAGATAVGVDLSFSVDAAFRNFGEKKNIHLVQADVFALPFQPGTFDCIYSIGVLHHTPDCREAFLKLPMLLKKGGKIGIWVYAAARSKVEDRSNRFWRGAAGLLPQPVLFLLCVMAAGFSYIRQIPFVKPMVKYLLPRLAYDVLPLINSHPDFQERVLKTFDWYSPTYQSRHTFPEVFAWFEEAGLTGIKIFPTAVAVQGTRSEA